MVSGATGGTAALAEAPIDDIATPARRGGAYRWYVVGVLALAYCFSAIDARILTLLVGPIKKDLGLGDFEISLLQGFAFSILYCAAAIPIGRSVDSSRLRTKLIIFGVLFWSAMTVLCGFARSFTQLFLARVGVGVGEATLSPTAYSLISDYFDSRQRALAISCYSIGYPIGGGLALIIGGALLDIFTRTGPISIGGLGTFQPWQMAFIVVGLPGVFIAALIATIKEPERRELAPGYGREAMPIRDVIAFIRQRGRVYLMLIGTVSLLGMLSIGMSLWYPTFLIRTYQMSPTEVGIYYGGMTLVFGTTGTVFGGWLSGRLMRKGGRDANIKIVLFTTGLKAIPLVIGPLMPTPVLALTCMAVGTLIGMAAQGVMLSAIQDVTPNQMRGQVTAVTLLCVNLIGIGCGASFIAAITDFGFGDENALRYSLSIAAATLLPAIIGLLLWGLPEYRRSLGMEASKGHA